jgi:hypothetical protein
VVLVGRVLLAAEGGQAGPVRGYAGLVRGGGARVVRRVCRVVVIGPVGRAGVWMAGCVSDGGLQGAIGRTARYRPAEASLDRLLVQGSA